MALKTREAMFMLETNIDTTQIIRTSRMVSNYTGMLVQPNKAIVGANAFAHEAGIHQDGMLKHHSTYEIMTPDMVGLNQSKLVLGKHSGRHAFRNRLQELGYELSDEQLQEAFARFKEVADKKKEITDADLEAIVFDNLSRAEEFFKLEALQVACGTAGMPTASIRIVDQQGHESLESQIGVGPVDAVYSAIDRVVDLKVNLLEYRVHAVTEGVDAQGEVSVRIALGEANQPDYRTFGGYAANPDVIVASAKAYMAALNRAYAWHLRQRAEGAGSPRITPRD